MCVSWRRVSTQPDVVSVEELYDDNEVLPSTTYNPFHENEPETRCSTRAIVTAQSTQSARASSLIIAEDLSTLALLSISLSLYLSISTEKEVQAHLRTKSIFMVR